jgi:IS5 family transposase
MTGRVFRDADRKLSDEGWERHRGTMFLTHFVPRQNRKGKGKFYSLHASEVEFMAKGKAHRPFEFGGKVSLAVTHKKGFVVGMQTCPENPYDGSSDPGGPPVNGRGGIQGQLGVVANEVVQPCDWGLTT